MKKIFILFLFFSLLSCDKDEDPTTLSGKYSKQEIFNAVVGTWKFNRLAYDPEFKKIENIIYKECGRNTYTIFEKDSTLTCIRDCGEFELVETGSFYIEIGDPTSKDNLWIATKGSGIILYPNMRYGNPVLYSFTDSTLVFSNVRYTSSQGEISNMYSELKRVR